MRETVKTFVKIARVPNYMLAHVTVRAIVSIQMGLGADHLTSEGGGGGGRWGWVILKKNILQVHMHRKKILAQDHRAKKFHARTVGWKKNSGKMFSELTH